MTVRDVPVVAAIDDEVAGLLRYLHYAVEPSLPVGQAPDRLGVACQRAMVDCAEKWCDSRAHAPASRRLAWIEHGTVDRHETRIEAMSWVAQRHDAVGHLL